MKKNGLENNPGLRRNLVISPDKRSRGRGPTAALVLAAAALMMCAVPAYAAPSAETVQIPVGNAILAGTLTIPEGHPKAAVVLVQGNGPHNRDQVISGAPMFKELANDLARRGIASIRVDNSGVGQSTGTRVAHFKQRVPQFRAVFDRLASSPRLSKIPLGLIGHSEGAMVATEIWQERGDPIDFLILLGAPAREGRAVWINQQSDPSRFPGKNKAVLDEIRATFLRIADASIARDKQALGRAADHLFALSGLTADEIAEARPGFISRMDSEEMRIFLSYDPAASYSRVEDPVLLVWGTHDKLTDAALNVPIFLANRHETSSQTLIVLPNEDHFFLRAPGLEPGKHELGKMQLSARLGEEIGRFVNALSQPNSDME